MWLEERAKRVEEIRKRVVDYYGWDTSSEYVLAKDELQAKASVDITYLLGEYDVMARVLREGFAEIKLLREFIEDSRRWGKYIINKGLNRKAYFDAINDVLQADYSDDAKELLNG